MLFARSYYYLRTNQDFFPFVILDFSEKNCCNIEIVCGGGGSAYQFSFLSEENAIKKIKEKIMGICEENKWKIIEQG